LGNEQSGYEEGLRPELYHSHVALAVLTGDHQVVGEKSVTVPFVQTEAVHELFCGEVSSVSLAGESARGDEDGLLSSAE
jgi:hypothetical protein